jgi:membrane-associated protease RseP (regulator of RpoE activity)
MKVTVLASLASFVVAFAAASWFYSAESEKPSTSSSGATSFDPALPVEDRIAALERAVSDERVARQLLQEEVFYLTSEVDRLSADHAFGRVDPAPVEATANAPAESGLSRREERRRRNSAEGRMQRLIEAGFLPSQASMIVQRESELQMEAIQARYEAERNDEPFDFFGSREATGEVLREELGDADYERYLEANNRSTSVSVSSVIESSPAQSAGLQAGDEIVRYNGERVFSMSDLTREALEGTAGQNVVVDIMRNGTPMQVVLPRGPIGITGGRRSR